MTRTACCQPSNSDLTSVSCTSSSAYSDNDVYENNFNSWKYIDEASLYSIPEDSREDVSQAGTINDSQHYPGLESYPPYPAAGGGVGVDGIHLYSFHSNDVSGDEEGNDCDEPKGGYDCDDGAPVSLVKPKRLSDAASAPSTDQCADATLASEDSSLILWASSSSGGRRCGESLSRRTKLLIASTCFVTAVVALAVGIGVSMSRPEQTSAASLVENSQLSNFSASSSDTDIISQSDRINDVVMRPQEGSSQSPVGGVEDTQIPTVTTNITKPHSNDYDFEEQDLSETNSNTLQNATTYNSQVNQVSPYIITPPLTIPPTSADQLYSLVEGFVFGSLADCTEQYDLTDTSSIQNSAAMTIINEIMFQAQTNSNNNIPAEISGNTIKERFALMTLYKSAGGRNWDTQTNWMTFTDVCDWYGVEDCAQRFEGSCTVVNLYLNFNNLQGILPKELCCLPCLQRLTVTNNDLTGQLPSCVSAMPMLSYLDLFGTNIETVVP